jgi:Short C-terminal domain
MWVIRALSPFLLFSIMMRRRPLARAAVVGGAAYYAGKKGAEASQREADQEARLQDLEGQQAYGAPPPQQYAAPAPPPPPAPAAGGLSEDSMAKLQQLAQLKEQGILTDAEFEVQKQKILQGM